MMTVAKGSSIFQFVNRVNLIACLALFVFTTCRLDHRYDDADFTKPDNIILLIGDGMGSAQVNAAYYANRGLLNMNDFTYTGYARTSSADNFITDSGAAATAIACGVKTNNYSIGVDPEGRILKTILEYARDHSLSTGLVVTSSITHATPAAFIAHVPSRSQEEDIAMNIVRSGISVFIGGGRGFFMNRSDSLNLIDSLLARHYLVADSDKFDMIQSGKLACFTAQWQDPKYSDGRGDVLPKATSTALTILSKNLRGFFVMIEGSQIDWGGHANDLQYVIDETLDFDRAVGVALNFARMNKRTLVIVTADHETGGLTITNGDLDTGIVEGYFTTTGHTAALVPVYAYGPGAERFTGVYENTALFDKMMELYGFKH